MTWEKSKFCFQSFIHSYIFAYFEMIVQFFGDYNAFVCFLIIYLESYFHIIWISIFYQPYISLTFCTSLLILFLFLVSYNSCSFKFWWSLIYWFFKMIYPFCSLRNLSLVPGHNDFPYIFFYKLYKYKCYV